MSKDTTFTITMLDGTRQEMTKKEIMAYFNLPERLAHGRLEKNLWRTEVLLKQTPEQARQANIKRMKRVLQSEFVTPKPERFPYTGHY